MQQYLAHVGIDVEPHYDPTLTAVRVRIVGTETKFGYTELIVTDHFSSVFDLVLNRAVREIKRQVTKEVENAERV